MATGTPGGGRRGPSKASRRRGGVPDGVLVGGLAFLLAGTAMVWLATGLAGLVTHGSWPAVRFSRTPAAVRELVRNPHDLAAAWDVPAHRGAMPGGTAFWVVLMVLLVLLTALVVTVLVLVARWRARHAAAVAGRRLYPTGPAGPDAGAAKQPGRYPEPAADGDGAPPAAHARAAEPAAETRTAPPAPSAEGRGRAVAAAGPAPSVPVAVPDADPGRTVPVPRSADPSAAPSAAPAAAPAPERPAVPSPAGPPDGAAALIGRHLSAQALRDRSSLIRPTLPRTGLAAVHHDSDLLAFGISLGTHHGPQSAGDLYGSLDQTFLLLAGARSDKGPRFLHPALAGAPGAAVITCPDGAAYEATAAAREKLGPVAVYDPLHRTDAPGRLRWAPEHGCADPLHATARARAMLFPLRPPGRPAMADSAVAARLSHHAAAETAQTLLACWLHAAALDGRTFRHVHRWIQHPLQTGLREPLRTLRTTSGAAPGWDGRLEQQLTNPGPERDDALALVQRALAATGELHVLQSCLPPASERFDPESWLAERGTLYIVGDPVEDPRAEPGVLALTTAFTADVVEHGRRMAVGSSSGRLDPPLLLLLDDAATLTPLPGLPDLMTGGGSLGLPTVCVLRSPEQARHRWGGAAAALHRTASVRLAMGEVPARDLAAVLGGGEAESARLADALHAAGPGARLVHHAAAAPVLADPS